MDVVTPSGEPPHARHTPQHARANPHRAANVRSLVFVAAIVMLLLGAGGYFVVTKSSTSTPRPAAQEGCQGEPVTATVAASPDQFAVMRDLATRWNDGAPAVDGRCVKAEVVEAQPMAVAAALSGSWNEERSGRRPDAWAPDSAAWLAAARARPDARPLLGSDAVSVASSAAVLALPRPMAEAMGWPRQPVRIPDVIGALTGGRTWASFGHPEWGALKFSMTDPTQSAAGLTMLLSLIDRDGDGVLSNTEITSGVSLTSSVTEFPPDAKAVIDALGRDGSLATAAAFPTDERQLVGYRAPRPELDLVPIYRAQDGNLIDHPYTVLTAPWVDETRSTAASQFRDFLLSDTGQRAYGAAGFRDATGSSRFATALTPDRGFDTNVRLTTKPPDPAAVNRVLAQWRLFQRPTNVLIVLDTSGSMNDRIPRLGITRLQLLQQSAVKGIKLLNSRSSMCLWQFSSRMARTADHRELVPFGPATAQVGGVPRRDALIRAINELKPRGGTGLYDTAYAASVRMRGLWKPDAMNLVVLITDGRNEFDKGLTRDQLLSRLQSEARPDRPVPIIGIAVGPEADADAMKRISAATGGRTFVARNDSDAIQQIILAFAGRLR